MHPHVRDFDLIVVGHETEGCLAAIAGSRAGARTALLLPPGRMLGGLLTEGGLAFVDRDSRHLTPPSQSPFDGLFGQFLDRAGVQLVALEAARGAATLQTMLDEAGVKILPFAWTDVRLEGARLVALDLADGTQLGASHFIDATPDLDLAAAAGLKFETGFSEYGLDRTLGFSPLPLVHGVSPAQIVETARSLGRDPVLEALKQKIFGPRAFLDLDHGIDYILLGPPYLGLAYQRWREQENVSCPYPFEADGFNIAVLGPETTSWNGLMYFSRDPSALLRLSHEGTDAVMRHEAQQFERFLQEGLGWSNAVVELPSTIYVRQTRHALETRHRLRLTEIVQGYDVASIGTFCYYPDFRGFHSPRFPHPPTAHVILEAGLTQSFQNLGLASRAGGYTPFAHSLCRLVQYNATLGTALGVAAALTAEDLKAVPLSEIRNELARQGCMADDPAGLERNPQVRIALLDDPLMRKETYDDLSTR